MTTGDGPPQASARVIAALLLVSAWLGSALLTVAIVTPAAFGVLPSRTLAGALVGRVLPSVFVSGLVLGGLVPWLVGLRRAHPLASVSALLAAAACAVAQFGVAPRIERLRADIGGPVERLTLDDPRRVAFGLLHGYSVAGLGVAMLAAVMCLAFLLVALPPRTDSATFS